MQRWRRWLIVVAIWLCGFGSALLYIAVSGGWYLYVTVHEHRMEDYATWELVHPATAGARWFTLRRPRLDLGGWSSQ